MPQPQILALAGSTRQESYNKKLLQVAVQAARQAGAEVTTLDLRDYPLPLFDEDLEREQGLPAPAARLKSLFQDHQGLLLASPEYNSSITAVLKNAIDWISRTQPGEAALAAFQGKVAALLSASPGNLGGLRGLVHLRSILGNIGVLVVPEQVAVPRAHEAFSSEGLLLDARLRTSVERLCARLAETVGKLH